MSSTELSSKYNSSEVETKWYTLWEKNGYFQPKPDLVHRPSSVRPYVIVIPPPNVTGILHVGHALNNTIQDILIRWNRMKGKDTLWIPGVDHAGIATQNVVEKKLAKEKITRQQLGREKFLEHVWKWKEENGNTITRQLRRLGASCDWSREAFTMDAERSKGVREAFVRLYEKDLIYQGDRIINWCPRCQTALSDEEAEHKEVEGGLYHIKYPIVQTSEKLKNQGQVHATSFKLMSSDGPVPGFVVVATTRPETMLGDTAVAVNPNDERYKHLIGKKLLLPLVNREIPIIADEFVDAQFGTGAVKVTPAHDPNDFEMGNRHNLERINVMHPDGKINEKGGPYNGMDRFEARKKIIADLEELGLFVEKKKHKHAVGHCYRCATVVEPYLSKQWFVKMKPLAEKALEAHRAGKTKFYPDRWTKVYTNWLEGIRDWCISRQIWWGHQVPVWYCLNCKKTEDRKQKTENQKSVDRGPSTVDRKGIIVSRETPTQCPTCGGSDLKQDPDVLDTWFSAWLWPFSTLGWPSVPGTAVPGSENPARNVPGTDLERFYPTSDLITAPEIIFFWVARMIMAGLEFMGEVPFSRIYIHGTVRAADGKKMSKSLGNSIDPLEVIDEMGADALRFSMIMLSAQDVFLSREKFEVGRNFVNKLWNASRFVLMKIQERNQLPVTSNQNLIILPNRWILSRLSVVSQTVDRYLSEFQLAQAATELYHFVWNDYCDWFIELTKPILEKGSDQEKSETQSVLIFVLEKILKLLHPFTPFVTEEIWQRLKEIASSPAAPRNDVIASEAKQSQNHDWPESIMLSSWPQTEFSNAEAEKAISWLQDAVTGIRDLRTRVNLPPSQTVQAVVTTSNPEVKKVFEAFIPQMKVLGRLEGLVITVPGTAVPGSENPARNVPGTALKWLGNAFPDFEVFIKIEGLVNPEEERKRIQKKIAEAEGWIKGINAKLSNENFIKNAPAEVVEQERTKLSDAQKLIKSYQEHLALFS